ncbi:MAG TPA: iron-sulfur cluster assembly protein [Thermodesulfobacteriota bacterium]|nr:iron-sulfur cluster assembly protein [Thermodesulfobacteriota bacterium]
MGMKKIISITKEDSKGIGESKVTLTGFQKSKGSDEQIEITEERVFETLKSVYDPELPVNIVDLGLIYDVQISGRNVQVKMSLTTPGCGMGAVIAKQAEDAIKTLGAKNVMVQIIWDPPWNPDMMSDEAKQKLGLI